MDSPLDVGQTINLMNNLIEDTPHEKKLIEWKMQRKLYNPDPEVPLLNWSWWRGFKRRNPDLETKTGRKYTRNRGEHCSDTTLSKMYNQVEIGLLKPGNAKEYDVPVHKDKTGNIVTIEILAFGRVVTCNITRPGSVFVMDKTGDNTHGKEDAANGCFKRRDTERVSWHTRLTLFPSPRH